jgi:hypothetical protein
MIRHKRRLLAVPAVAVLGVGVGLASADSGSAPVPVFVETAPPAYKVPAGPPMTPAAAERIALTEAQRAGDPSPTDVTQMEGTFAQTHAILSRGHGKLLETPETKEWLRSDTYMTVMHGHFTSRLVAPGSEPVHGSVMVVISEAQTGLPEGEYIGPSAPNNAALRPVPVSSGGAAAALPER